MHDPRALRKSVAQMQSALHLSIITKCLPIAHTYSYLLQVITFPIFYKWNRQNDKNETDDSLNVVKYVDLM